MRMISFAAAAAAVSLAAPAAAQYTSREVAATTVTSQANALTLSDDASAPVNLGFAFNFYGNSFTSTNISSNGFLSFTSNASGCCGYDDIGSNPSVPNNVVAGLWLDFFPPNNQGISFGTTGAAGSRVFTVAFNQVQFFDTRGTGRSATFSMSLYEGSNNILLNYNALQVAGVDDLTSAGIEDSTGLNGLRIFGGEAQVVAPDYQNRAFLIGTNLAGVPEPTTWALLILGFGAIGGAMRRRAATTTRVAFA